MKITPEYLVYNKQLHAEGRFGFTGSRWAQTIQQLCAMLNTRDVLDYGCGQRSLEKSIGFPIRNYDPAIEGLDAAPEPADLVACTDVLEHVEPECLDDVLDDLQRVTKQAALLVIANRPSSKALPDGRNAHLIQEGSGWWIPKLQKRFLIHHVHELSEEMIIIVRKPPRFAGLAVY
jgi:hypothetical protein